MISREAAANSSTVEGDKDVFIRAVIDSDGDFAELVGLYLRLAADAELKRQNPLKLNLLILAI